MKSASALPSSNSASEAQVATVTYSEEDSKEKDDRWCFALVTDSNCQAVKGSVLIDCGKDEHVCRKEFAPAYETQPDPHPVTLRDVQRGVLQQYGITAAQCALKVADVNDDVLSLGRLLRRGFEFDLSLGRGCSMFPRTTRQGSTAISPQQQLAASGSSFGTCDLGLQTSGDGGGSRRGTTR